MRGIENKVIVITSGSSGVCAETARHLVQAGAKVVLGARRLDRLQALAKELGLWNESVVQTDVADLAQVAEESKSGIGRNVQLVTTGLLNNRSFTNSTTAFGQNRTSPKAA